MHRRSGTVRHSASVTVPDLQRIIVGRPAELRSSDQRADDAALRPGHGDAEQRARRAGEELLRPYRGAVVVVVVVLLPPIPVVPPELHTSTERMPASASVRDV
jgi:hypothetical protein